MSAFAGFRFPAEVIVVASAGTCGSICPTATSRNCWSAPIEDVSLAEPVMSGAVGRKYQPLTDWLLAQTADEPPTTFEDLEEVLGSTLPFVGAQPSAVLVFGE